jgi:hypothetical protein
LGTCYCPKITDFGKYFGSNLQIVYPKFKQKFALEYGKYCMQLKIIDLTLPQSRGQEKWCRVSNF